MFRKPQWWPKNPYSEELFQGEFYGVTRTIWQNASDAIWNAIQLQIDARPTDPLITLVPDTEK